MKFIKPTDSAPRNTGRASARDKAKEAAIEAELARYLHLECGHFCPKEVALLYSVFGDGTQVMCERCGDFKDIRSKPRIVDLPDTPLF